MSTATSQKSLTDLAKSVVSSSPTKTSSFCFNVNCKLCGASLNLRGNVWPLHALLEWLLTMGKEECHGCKPIQEKSKYSKELKLEIHYVFRNINAKTWNN